MLLMKTSDYRKEVTERIIDMLESGSAPWQKPWDAGVGRINRPHNFNGRPYHGVNALLLWYTAQKNGYSDPRWLTYNQVKKLGGHVNKGEKAQIVEYWQWQKEIENPETGVKEKVDLERPYVFRAAVFNGSQCSGIGKYVAPVANWAPHERAENIVIANGVPVYHSEVDAAYYTPSGDYVCLPPRASFATEDAYYSTLLHEVGHSTGHPSRLNREQSGRFGTEDYAKEELRAELASTFLCAELGITLPGGDEQHAAYVKSWVKALKDDYNEIFRAAADAEKICNYLYDREKEYLKQKEAGIEVPTVFDTDKKPPSVIMQENVVARMTMEEKAALDKQAANALPRDIVVVQMAQNMPIPGKVAFLINDKLYMGDKEYYGSNGLYDNSDNTLQYVSDRLNAFYFMTGREFPDSAEVLLKRGEVTKEDFLEYRQLKEHGVLAEYEKQRFGDVNFAGKSFEEAYKSIMEKGERKMPEEKDAAMPASDAQKGFMLSLGCKFAEDITKDEASRLIKERLAKREAYFEKRNAPASQEQKDTLRENNCQFAENITVGEASKIIGNLPCTALQLKYLDRLKIEHSADVTRNEAQHLLHKNFREVEERDKQPATEKQLRLLQERGAEFSPEITRGEARTQIYLGSVTDKQLKFLNDNHIDYDAQKICYGRAVDLINKFKAERNAAYEAVCNVPASETQLNTLNKLNVKYKENINRGEAYRLINKTLREMEAVTDKQKEKAAKLGIELAGNIKRDEAAKIIEIKVRENAVKDFAPKKNVKTNVYDKYLELANKQYKKNNDLGKIDDKKIAANLLKNGFDKEQVRSAITEKSPAGRNFRRADELVEAAAKIPSVKAKIKEAEAAMSR